MTDSLHQVEQAAKAAFQKGDYASAKRLFLNTLTLAEAKPNPDRLYLAQVLNNLGFVHQCIHDFVLADQYYARSLEIYRALNNGDSAEFAIALHNAGRTAYLQKNSKAAWNYWTEELDMWKRLKNPDCTHYVATCLQACGEVMADAGEFERARRNFEQALELRQNVLPSNHADIADNFFLLARLCEAQKDRPAARTYFKKALPLFVSALGKSHPVVKDIENSLKRLG